MPQSESRVELVVARYNEDLSWLRNVPRELRVTVYDKHPTSPHSEARRLANVGREAHSYLHHVVNGYADLAPLTVFCQGRPFDHAYDFHYTLRHLATSGSLQNENGFEWFGHLVDTDDKQGQRLFVDWSKNEDQRHLDVQGFHEVLLDAPGPELYTFRGGAQFAVTSDVIRSRPRSFYVRALELSVSWPDAAHCFERLWPLVFGVENPDLAWLQGRQTVYLKPVRRLMSE
jgi:hypothetical protein